MFSISVVNRCSGFHFAIASRFSVGMKPETGSPQRLSSRRGFANRRFQGIEQGLPLNQTRLDGCLFQLHVQAQSANFVVQNFEARRSTRLKSVFSLDH